ncbi:MAG: phenylpropionate dioxygenase [Rhodospirillaceae bacterium TMED167]|nr:phenylpropionate dioxygenase [Rhodospirillaceae bacterium]OUW30956.1 MAG: phenylpropionate dioxygenase [Rhodospirillaceae bacterium TMED167]
MSVTEQDLIDFVVREARLLDEARYEDWLALFTADGRYWMPLEPGQTEEKLVTSLLYEDMILLTTRVRRLTGKLTYSQQPKSRGVHILQVPSVDSLDEAANTYLIHTPFLFIESRRDEKELYAGWIDHTLMEEEDGLKIKMKRVELVNCDAAHHNMQLII